MNSAAFAKFTTDGQKLDLLGTIASAQTKFGEDFKGRLYYMDEKSIILSTPINHIEENQDEYILLNCDVISHIETVSHEEPKTTLLDLLQGNCTIEQIASQGGILGSMMASFVPSREQLLFDHLTKMYKDTQWGEGLCILLPTLKIKIVSPYDESHCMSTEPGPNKALERIKKMVAKALKDK